MVNGTKKKHARGYRAGYGGLRFGDMPRDVEHSQDPTNAMKTRRAAPAGFFCLLAIRLVREWSERPAASLQAQRSWFSGLPG